MRITVSCLLLAFALLFNTHLLTAQQSFDPNKIDIVRDSFGTPHIFAKTDAEVAYGLAWATAEDDMTNAQWMLMAIKGVLAKHLGVEGAKIDFAVQMMGVNDYVDAHINEVPADYLRVLEGYCAGINAYVAAHPEEVLVKGTFPVGPKDILVGYMLGQALMCGVDGAINSIVSGSVLKNIPIELRPGIGSNSFAYNSNKTVDGSTYLAVNAHQPIEGLLSWYEAHVCSEEGWNIVGAMFHGSPAIFLGTNEYLGWAHTTGQLDTKDIYMLSMHPKKKKKLYKYDGEWLKLEKHKAKMKVAVGKKKRLKIPVSKAYWTSVYGPTLVTKHGTFALRMPALLNLKPAEQWYRMNKATNFTEFYEALNIQGLAQQNITYADKYDTIMFIGNGLFPKRNPNYDWTKVVPGDTSATLWTEYYPESALAQVINPKAGYLFNANNASFHCTDPAENLDPNDFDPHMGYEMRYTNRSLRFYEMIAKLEKVSYQDFWDIKYDVAYPDSMMFVRDFPINELFTLSATDHPEIADALKHFKDFDQVCDKADTNFPIILHTFYNLYHKGKGKVKDSLAASESYREAFFVDQIRLAQDTMMKYFGKLGVRLDEVQFLQRGDVAIGVDGGPDILRAVYCEPWENGKLREIVGDSYIQMVRFTEDGPEIQSVNAYGASSKPDSPHYTDQMQLYADHKMKKMSLDKKTVYDQAVEIYHPEPKK